MAEVENQDIQINRNAPLEDRVFRLESAVISMSRTEGEMMDKLKNAHHRIDETNRNYKELKEEMQKALAQINTKVENLGINLAEKDKRDRKWHKVLVIVGIMAFAAFVGMFIKNAEVSRTIGELAVKFGIGVASAF